VGFLRRYSHIGRIMLIGDSGGSLVAGLYATRRPEVVSRLILFRPEAPFTEGPPTDVVLPAYVYVVPADLWGNSQIGARPPGQRGFLCERRRRPLRERRGWHGPRRVMT